MPILVLSRYAYDISIIRVSHSQAVLPFLGFSVALFAFSSVVPFVLLWGGATVLNLSLLTSDVWAALARQVLFGELAILPQTLIKPLLIKIQVKRRALGICKIFACKLSVAAY